MAHHPRTNPDPARAHAWAMDYAGRVLESKDVPDAFARGWVDAVGGVGRIESVSDRRAGAGGRALDALHARYPGVRWLADAGLV